MTIAVAYLVGKKPEPFRRFLQSYEQHPAGIAHELVLVTNAWSAPLPAEIREMIAMSGLRYFEATDVQFDLDAYYAAASQLDAEHFCFLNSYSEVLDDGWLAKLHAAILTPGVGLAGATGSYESHYSGYVEAAPGAARRTLSPLKLLRGVINVFALRRDYDPFPNPHVRSNAFMIARETFLRIGGPRFRTKGETERVESGKRGLSRSVEQLGLAAVVAGRDGVVYPRERYRESHTFRIGEQCNLLVADNRTVEYANADAEERRALRRLAWGDDADVRCPRCGGTS